MDAKLIISEARLGTYLQLTGNHEEKAIELHNMTLQVGSSLSAVIALIEIGLRNLVNDQLIQDYGDPNWMVDIIDNGLRNAKVPLRIEDERQLKKAKSRLKKRLILNFHIRIKKCLRHKYSQMGFHGT